jgi:hypothetical protein
MTWPPLWLLRAEIDARAEMGESGCLADFGEEIVFAESIFSVVGQFERE